MRAGGLSAPYAKVLDSGLRSAKAALAFFISMKFFLFYLLKFIYKNFCV
ncbi:hypothetical protein HMPREF1139_0260 [Campylobacter sp. FOBRC14]|nr:hypothetical protein HMPREF1139_0260 [Campylobacter sp. FOBRC14]